MEFVYAAQTRRSRLHRQREPLIEPGSVCRRECTGIRWPDRRRTVRIPHCFFRQIEPCIEKIHFKYFTSNTHTSLNALCRNSNARSSRYLPERFVERFEC